MGSDSDGEYSQQNKLKIEAERISLVKRKDEENGAKRDDSPHIQLKADLLVRSLNIHSANRIQRRQDSLRTGLGHAACVNGVLGNAIARLADSNSRRLLRRQVELPAQSLRTAG